MASVKGCGGYSNKHAFLLEICVFSIVHVGFGVSLGFFLLFLRARLDNAC